MKKKKQKKKQPGIEAASEEDDKGETKPAKAGSQPTSDPIAPAKAEEKSARFQFAIVGALFVLSGLSSLIYQVIWTRQLVFVFGSTTFASSTVLSVFMGGLALGAFLAGRYSEKIKNPFLCYGILEGIIGIWAIFAPQMFELAIPIYKIAWQQTHMSVLPFSFLRFVVVSFILLPPTACMGATLPLLSRFVTNRLELVADKVGTLYALNTYGAVCGAIMAGFFLIPGFGLSVSTIAAAGTNILLAIAVFILARKWQAKGETSVAPLTESVSEKLPVESIAVILAFAISGAIAMVNEVAWTRTLLMVIGSTTYAFTVMLSTFLIGIFGGSFLFARFTDRLKNPFLWFALMQIAVGAASLLSIFLFNYLPYWNLQANLQFSDNPEVGMYVRFALAAIVLFPISLFLGAIFPLAVKNCSKDLQKVGRSVGALYSANTFGAIIGAASAGFLIIPALGGEQTLLACAVANFALGFLLLLLLKKEAQTLQYVSGCILLLLAGWMFSKPQVWDRKIIVCSQKERRNLAGLKEFPSYEVWKRGIDGALNILFWEDGLCSNVAVIDHKNSDNISLLTNGHVDASCGSGDMVTQAALSAIPLLVKPGLKNVGVVGWGSGTTAGYAFLFPIKRLVCAELEKYVIDTSRFFRSINFSAEQDPRLALEINDGRNYLLATDESFDLLISEPSNPWQAGVCNLYTREFFEICKARLNQDGVFALWWQGNEVSIQSLIKVMASLRKTFKHATVFCIKSGSYCAIASDQPLRIDLSLVAETLKNKKLHDAVAGSVSISTSEDLASMLCLVDDGINKAVAGAELNTDDRNYIEYEVAKTYEQKKFDDLNETWFLSNAGSLWDAIDWKSMNPNERAEEMARISEAGSAANRDTAKLWAEQSFKTCPNAHALALRAFYSAQETDDYEKALQLVEEGQKQFPANFQTVFLKGLVKLYGGALLRARADFETALQLQPDSPGYKFRLAQTYFPEPREWYQKATIALADDGKAQMNAQKVLDLLGSIHDPNFFSENPSAELLWAAAKLHLKADDGIKLMESHLDKYPSNVAGWQMLANAYAAKNNMSKSIFCRTNSEKTKVSQSGKMIRRAYRRLQTGNYELCLAGIQNALTFNPSSREARVLLSKLAQKYDKADKFQASLQGR